MYKSFPEEVELLKTPQIPSTMLEEYTSGYTKRHVLQFLVKRCAEMYWSGVLAWLKHYLRQTNSVFWISAMIVKPSKAAHFQFYTWNHSNKKSRAAKSPIFWISSLQMSLVKSFSLLNENDLKITQLAYSARSLVLSLYCCVCYTYSSINIVCNIVYY